MAGYKAVFSGSGCLYPTQVGALRRIAQGGNWPTEVLGVSGGALVGATVAMGMSYSEIVSLVRSINPSKYLDSNIASLAVFAFPFNTDGFFAGDRLLGLLRGIFPKYMGDLKLPMSIVTENVSLRRSEMWNSKITPDADLPLVLRASMSLPLIFNPVSLPMCKMGSWADKGGAKFVHQDGGMGANFPLDYFGTGDDVVGFRFRPSPEAVAINNKYDLLCACLDSMLEANMKATMMPAVHARTVYIETTFRPTDFDLTPAKIERMLQDGEASADKALRVRRLSIKGVVNA